MPLGPQFRNTFHEGANGAVFHTDLNTLKDKDELDPKALQKPHTDSKGVPGVAYQGMLMDPYAYTGHRKDPTISEEERRGAVRGALKLGAENKVEYALNKVPKGKAAAYDTAIENAGHESGIPTHMLKENVSVPVIAKKTLGKNTGGDYGANGRRHAIRIREGWPQRDIIGEETITHQDTVSGNPIPNPNFKDVLKAHPTANYAASRMSKVHTPTGETKDLSDYTDPNREDKYMMHDPRDLPEGHHMNVWAGKGEDTDKYYAYTYKVSNGYTDSGRRKSAFLHTRHEKLTVGEPRQVTRTLYSPERSSVSSGTLVHEVGHSIDPHIDERGGYIRGGQDTVKEATADGFEDRFHLHKDNYEEALHPSPERAAEMKVHGYTVKSKLIATHDTDRALYAAVRQHVSMGDKNYKDVEKRSSLLHASGQEFDMQHGNNRSEGNKLLLGHLYSKHAHVRDILGHLGLSHVGEDAAEHYRSQITDAGRSNNPYEAIDKGRFDRHRTSNFKQQAFPGMEE